MTWHHVAIIFAALFTVAWCGSSTTCAPTAPAMMQLATVVISGALGHAGANVIRKRASSDHAAGEPGEHGGQK